MRISDWSSDVCSSDLCRNYCPEMNRSRPKEEEHQLRRCWRPSAILSDDVGNKGVLQNADLVAQKQFPFFQTGRLHRIPTARIYQLHERRIQFTFLLEQVGSSCGALMCHDVSLTVVASS